MENNFFIWEEKNSIEPTPSARSNTENDNEDTTEKTETGSTRKDSNDTILKRKRYHKSYYAKNKDEFRKRYLKNRSSILTVRRKYVISNLEKIKSNNKSYRDKNRNRLRKYYKNYYTSNRDRCLKQKREYHKIHKGKRTEYNRTWYKNNVEHVRIYNQKNRNRRRKYQRDRRETDVNYRLRINLRNRLHGALRGNYKAGSAVRDLGCTIPELRSKLESQFAEGMNWDNYGEWHIDHIKPLSKFNLANRQDCLEAFHFSNLQPLWKKDNLQKSDRYEF
jgi:hypothetical protein